MLQDPEYWIFTNHCLLQLSTRR